MDDTSTLKMDMLSDIDKQRLALTGLEIDMKNRAGSFFLKDQNIGQIVSKSEGVEVLSFSNALEKYPKISEYVWKLVNKDKDKFTKFVAKQEKPNGFVIIAHKGSKTTYPIQACMLMDESPIQHVHNIIIAEEDAEVHIISGCTSGEKRKRGTHIGITEIYVGPGAKVTSTMIHNWGKDIAVFPRSAIVVEKNGTFLSNYVCMQPVRKIQMAPTCHLNGEHAVGRFSSIVSSEPGSLLDLGSTAILNAKGTSAELITRAITTGGTIISRGRVDGAVAETKAHIECKGLILKDGIIHAIPEIKGDVVDTELSHEAAVGKIAKEEIEYLMARGLDEAQATATIIRGFLDVKIDGLPSVLQDQIDAAIDKADSSGF
jgi:Fe-S cluster assembly scaffold protein SufB